MTDRREWESRHLSMIRRKRMAEPMRVSVSRVFKTADYGENLAFGP